MWQMHDVGAGWWIVMSLGMIAFCGLVIWAVVAVLRGTWPSSRTDADTPPAEILKRRLARGEITTEEYEQLRDALRDDPALAERRPVST